MANRWLIYASMVGMLFLSACAKTGSSNSPGAASCSAVGTVYAGPSYGCLPSCGIGMVYTNNFQCVPIASLTNPTTCPAGQLNTPLGCLPKCGAEGANTVTYQNQCLAISALPSSNSGSLDICRASCGAGQVETFFGCLPQGQCGACYGQGGGTCYQGVNARYYFGF